MTANDDANGSTPDDVEPSFEPYQRIYLARYRNVAARQLLAARESDPDECAADDDLLLRKIQFGDGSEAVAAAEDDVDPLFGSVRWRGEPEPTGSEDDYGFWYRHWSHRHVHDLPHDIKYLQIDDELKRGVAHYISHPEMHDKWLDWYCADTLTYTEYVSTAAAVAERLGGMSGAMIVQGGWAAFWGYFFRLFWFLIKWGLWLLAAIVIGDQWDAIGVFTFMVPTVAWVIVKRRRRGKIAKLLAEMAVAYQVFASTTFSWEIAWAELNRTRELGVVWPGELYKLVETKRTVR